jgi:hypothetical protein
VISTPVANIYMWNAIVPLCVGSVLAVLVVWFVLSRRPSFRQRTLWLACLTVALATIVLFDGIELRVTDGQFYWRSDWDWELGGGGVTEAVAASALFVGPLLAAALVYSAVVLWGRPRMRRRSWVTALCVVAVPVALLTAVGLYVGLVLHPHVLYPPRTS